MVKYVLNFILSTLVSRRPEAFHRLLGISNSHSRLQLRNVEDVMNPPVSW